MTLGLSSTAKQARSAALRDAIDGAATAGQMLLYADPQPATGASPSGVLVATIVFDAPCGLVDATGLTLSAALPGQAIASGLIRWARIVDGGGNHVLDGAVRMPADSDIASADFVIDEANVLAGGLINLISAAIAEGG